MPSYSSSVRARWQSGRGSAVRRTSDRFHPHVRNIGSQPDLQPILVLVQGSLERSRSWAASSSEVGSQAFTFDPPTGLLFGLIKDLRLEGSSPGPRASSIPTLPSVAPHTPKIHTLITLGIRHRAKELVSKLRRSRPRGFDSHRPLHFPASLRTSRDTRFVSRL